MDAPSPEEQDGGGLDDLLDDFGLDNNDLDFLGDMQSYGAAASALPAVKP